MGGWHPKKDRKDQHRLIRELATAIIDAEEEVKDRDDDDDTALSYEELLAKSENVKGLCREESLSIFLTWFSFGGMQRGISPQEAMDMYAWLRIDFQTILSEISKERRKRKKAKSSED